MSRLIDIGTILTKDRSNPTKERCLPWEEARGGLAVVVEPKPHRVDDLRVFRLDRREYCHYSDWLASGGHARFCAQVDTNGADLLSKARTMLAREIAEGLWDEVT